VDERTQPTEPTEQTGEEAADEAAEPGQGRPEPPQIALPVQPFRTRRRGGGISRWTTLGCGAGVALLIGLLLFGTQIARRTAWMALARGERRVLAEVERSFPMERLRTARNLDRFRSELRRTREPYAAMGEFLAAVRAAFEDGSLNAQELVEINRVLESHLPPGALLE
jgi:hypothetical protein